MHCAQGKLIRGLVTVGYKQIALLHTEKASVLSISSEVVTQVSCSLRFINTSEGTK